MATNKEVIEAIEKALGELFKLRRSQMTPAQKIRHTKTILALGAERAKLKDEPPIQSFDQLTKELRTATRRLNKIKEERDSFVENAERAAALLNSVNSLIGLLS